MNKKEKILQQLSDQRIAAKKYSLSLMSDLQVAIDEVKSFDLEYSFDKVFTEYEVALFALEEAKRTADKYIEEKRIFVDNADAQWESYQRASELYSQISNQLYDLGVEESPELSQYGDDLAEAETAGQKAFEQTQSEFSDHNELVDVSNFN